MIQETINQFRDYLTEQGHTPSTISGYIRTVSDLDEPPGAIEPLILFEYIEQAITKKRNCLVLQTLHQHKHLWVLFSL